MATCIRAWWWANRKKKNKNHVVKQKKKSFAAQRPETVQGQKILNIIFFFDCILHLSGNKFENAVFVL